MSRELWKEKMASKKDRLLLKVFNFITFLFLFETEDFEVHEALWSLS